MSIANNSYPEIHRPFIWASFLLAIIGGFGLAGHLSYVLGVGGAVGVAFPALVQAHGQLQLFGWIGMLLFGVSLYVLPRLLSSPTQSSQISWIFRFALVGILFRVIPPIVACYFDSSLQPVFQGLTFFGALAQAIAIGIYLFFVFSRARSGRIDRNDLLRLLPYFLPMLLGWLVFGIGNLWSIYADPFWSSFVLEAFIRLTIIPAILGFGVKMLPIFLGLRPPLWPVKKIGWLIASSTCLLLSSRITGTAGVEFGAVATLILSGSLVWYVWELDALLFRIKPERVTLKVFRSDAVTHRGRFGDRGEYGRFELFIVAGFAWLVVVSVAEAINALAFISGQAAVISPLVVRHIWLLGFVSHLVFGVGHRLLPNLLQTKLRSPKLTLIAFCLLFAATLSRVLPFLLTDLGITAPKHFFASSGTLGLLAITVFALNLRPKKVL